MSTHEDVKQMAFGVSVREPDRIGPDLVPEYHMTGVPVRSYAECSLDVTKRPAGRYDRARKSFGLGIVVPLYPGRR